MDSLRAGKLKGIFMMLLFFCVLYARTDAWADKNLKKIDFSTITLTNISQVRAAAEARKAANYAIELKGIVLWAAPAQNQLILQDATGGTMVKMNLRNQPGIKAGDQVLIKGNCQVGKGGKIAEALIDNDGVHASIEKFGTTFLSAGWHPVTIEWFNGDGEFELKLHYQGPEMPRQPVPNSAFSRISPDSTGETDKFAQGLNYRCYEGKWERLPDFSKLPIVKRGVTTNLNLAVRPRDTHVGLVFSGYFKVPRNGDYTFWLKSDDGGKLFIGNQLRLMKLGKIGMPPPREFIPGQFASKELELQWVEVEGVVTRVSAVYQGVTIELTFGAERIYLKVPAGNYDALSRLLHSRIKAAGIYQNAYGSDGQTVPSILISNPENIAITEMDAAHWAGYPITPISSLIKTNFAEKVEKLVHTSGVIVSNFSDKFLTLKDAGGQVLIETNGVSQKFGNRIETLGWWSREGGNVVLRGSISRAISKNKKDAPTKLPLLTKAIQIKSLSRSEAERGYPVKIQGVITARIDNNFVMQDATWSIFCYGGTLENQALPQIGEVWEIGGNSDVQFAPDVIAHQATYLGPGILPEPIRPVKDELINGSLDTQYIELQGIATDIETNGITLLTREGKIQFYGLEQPNLGQYKDALIHIRGVCIPNRDTNQMLLPVLSPIRLFNASVSMDAPAPAHPFDIPLKHISDLRLFDASADALRRIRISGQILMEYRGEYFLEDGGAGARFELKEPVKLEAGDLAQVVGFPDVSGPAPVLREALARVSAKVILPEARFLSKADMWDNRLDATLVSIKSRLVSMNKTRLEETLELQAGTRSYLARLAAKHGVLPDILPGSLLKLTGVYAAQGAGKSNFEGVNSFELLLASPSDVQVLARPSWWTVRHTLIVVGSMLILIFGATVWITLLHRQVEKQTRQLASEIKGREQAEYQRALEAERTRIAQDLHDELGATLTEIRFLGAVKSRDASVMEDMRFHLKEVSEKSRQMVSSLDEIVWAVNPANDALPSLANYLCHLAEEFFHNAEMRCRLDVDELLPSISLTSEVRHSLYLVVREALNNVAKHSQATEAWLRIHYQKQVLQIMVEDNGRGFSSAAKTGNGLSNMRSRIKKIGGKFECETQPGRGTICRIHLPLT